jgi:hypothetical protein
MERLVPDAISPKLSNGFPIRQPLTRQPVSRIQLGSGYSAQPCLRPDKPLYSSSALARIDRQLCSNCLQAIRSAHEPTIDPLGSYYAV